MRRVREWGKEEEKEEEEGWEKWWLLKNICRKKSQKQKKKRTWQNQNKTKWTIVSKTEDRGRWMFCFDMKNFTPIPRIDRPLWTGYQDLRISKFGTIKGESVKKLREKKFSGLSHFSLRNRFLSTTIIFCVKNFSYIDNTNWSSILNWLPKSER